MRIGHVASSAEVLASPLLRQLHAQTRLLTRLDKVLAERLPRFRGLCRVAGYRDGVLTLVTANTSLAGQIRYMQASLQQTLREAPEFAGLDRIRISPAVPEAAKRPQRPPLPPLSPAVGRLLRETAELIDDAELSEALLRLASHASDNRTTPPETLTASPDDCHDNEMI